MAGGKTGILRYFLRAVIQRPMAIMPAVLMVSAISVSSNVRLEFLDSAAVDDTVIKIGDISRVIGPDSQTMRQLRQICVGEAAPVGYCRFVAIGDVARLIGRMNLKDVTIDPKENRRLVVKTSFQEKSVGDFEDAILRYLHKRIFWSPADYTVEIRNRNEKWKCLKKPFEIKIDGLSEKYPKGNINLALIALQGTKQFKTNVSCLITVITPVAVAREKIPRNGRITKDNCSVEKKDITHFNYMPYTTLSELYEKALTRSIAPGTIIHEKIIAREPFVQRGEHVGIIVVNGRIRVCMEATARESGFLGDHIWVENEMTHKLLRVKVIAHGKVILSQLGDGAI